METCVRGSSGGPFGIFPWRECACLVWVEHTGHPQTSFQSRERGVCVLANVRRRWVLLVEVVTGGGGGLTVDMCCRRSQLPARVRAAAANVAATMIASARLVQRFQSGEFRLPVSSLVGADRRPGATFLGAKRQRLMQAPATLLHAVFSPPRSFCAFFCVDVLCVFFPAHGALAMEMMECLAGSDACNASKYLCQTQQRSRDRIDGERAIALCMGRVVD